MRVALIAPPFIPIPPKKYGGTELFIAVLAEALQKSGIEVVVYTNAESTIRVETRCLYAHSQWPIRGDFAESLRDYNHSSWAIRDAASDCDVIHIHNISSLMFSRYANCPSVYTLHHVHQEAMSEIYSFFPTVEYVAISDFQRQQEEMPRLRTIHHGVDLDQYRSQDGKREYLSFLGRIAPIKGTHLAIEVAKKAGIPLKIAGEVQPMFQEYFDTQIKPHLDGKLIEYVGEVDLAAKNELLSNSLAMLFPIQWDEPFGLVMIEAMACGAPVLALPGGSVPEVVRDGISGYICNTPQEMAQRARALPGEFAAATVRQYCQQYFSAEKMAAGYVNLYQELTGQQELLADTATIIPTAA